MPCSLPILLCVLLRFLLSTWYRVAAESDGSQQSTIHAFFPVVLLSCCAFVSCTVFNFQARVRKCLVFVPVPRIARGQKWVVGVHVDQCMLASAVALRSFSFGHMTVPRYRSRSCASASVLRMGQKCFGIVPVRQCFKIAFLQKVVLCKCISIAHGSDMFYGCSSWPMSDIASLQGVLCQCLSTLANALKHGVPSKDRIHRTPRCAWECGGCKGLHGTFQPPGCESRVGAFCSCGCCTLRRPCAPIW